MSTSFPAYPPFSLPDAEQAIALQMASDYLTRVGTQAATFLLGCPKIDGDTALIAEFSNTLLNSAALCAGLVEIADEQDRRSNASDAEYSETRDAKAA
ncbi:MAG: hypothetical protein IT338_00160 [Thermomicrobiales bacterium]|nr:hypothetical protein [Thermomicrobiales bacterium]